MSAPSDTALSHQELVRYSRHLLLEQVGVAGQQRLREARVLVVGAGGLGSPAALYLAAAGVGTIGIADGDALELSNLQRQVLHDTAAVGRPKVDSAAERIEALNPHVAVERIAERLDSSNALDLVGEYDAVVDGSDNFPTRYLVNDACVLTGTPNAYGAILRFDGQASLFVPGEGPCYRCLFAEPPPAGLVPSCAEAGVIGALPGIIGSIQAMEVIKRVLGVGESLVGRLLLVDAMRMRTREIAIRRDPRCPVCGDAPTVRELIDYEAFCGTGSSAGAGESVVTARALAAELQSGTAPVLLDVREDWEWDLVHLDGAVHVPLGELPARLRQLDARAPLVTICHHGARSARAQELLRGAGFAQVRNLAGGIDAWAAEVEPGMTRY
jgi:adenylyltransferase/sulfurtransferase